MKKIKLNRGYFALVDDGDYDSLSCYSWSVQVTKYTNYSYARIDGKLKYMHRFILGLTDPKVLVDHKDRNGLNNQRENIRPCNNSENQKNKRPSGKSKFLGVSFNIYKKRYISKKTGEVLNYSNTRWLSTININGKQKCLGSFVSEIDAAKKYDEAAKEYHGEFANLNFK